MRAGLSAVLMAVCVNSHAGWAVTAKQDEMTDQTDRYAGVRIDGASFYLYEEGPQRFVAGFRSRQIIHYEPRSITLRVDKNPAVTVPFTAWEPRIVFVRVPIRVVDQIMAGKTLKVQFPVSSNLTEVKTFTLSGAAGAIKTALPSYKPLSERTPSNLSPAMVEALKTCPDVVQDFHDMELRYGTPQLWQGCDGAYR